MQIKKPLVPESSTPQLQKFSQTILESVNQMTARLAAAYRNYELAKKYMPEDNPTRDMNAMANIEIAKLEFIMGHKKEAKKRLENVELEIIGNMTQYFEKETIENKMERTFGKDDALAKVFMEYYVSLLKDVFPDQHTIDLMLGAKDDLVFDIVEVIPPALELASVYHELGRKEKANALLQFCRMILNEDNSSMHRSDVENLILVTEDKIKETVPTGKIELDPMPVDVCYSIPSLGVVDMLGLGLDDPMNRDAAMKLAGELLTGEPKYKMHADIPKTERDSHLAVALAYLGDIIASKELVEKILKYPDYRSSMDVDVNVGIALVLCGEAERALKIAETDYEVRLTAVRYYVREAAKNLAQQNVA